ncbi:hypothetical protein [Maribellus sp. YY47]|uniref:hypothetical protein n=1 Tax=Maribellus sp. YY47 TaxID=2929486 RepID=UPI002001463C|nr:hypothetical protein [Maribellus sp. YY47]MCK3682801.1 hypothetical protein [Maribellus sp. YY47]
MGAKQQTAPERTAGTTNKSTQKTRYVKSQAVKELERIADEEARKKFPVIPFEWLAPRRYRDDTANGLTKCIIDFLRFHGHQAERIANMGRRIDTRENFVDVIGRARTSGESKWIPGNGTKGTADISATIKGISVKIEVKIGSDRQSVSQKRYQKSIESAGGIYFVANSFDSFYKWHHLNFGNEKGQLCF